MNEQWSLSRANVKALNKSCPHSSSESLWPLSTTTIFGKRFFKSGKIARFSIWAPSLTRSMGGGEGPLLLTFNNCLIYRTNAMWTMNHLQMKEKLTDKSLTEKSKVLERNSGATPTRQRCDSDATIGKRLYDIGATLINQWSDTCLLVLCHCSNRDAREVRQWTMWQCCDSGATVIAREFESHFSYGTAQVFGMQNVGLMPPNWNWIWRLDVSVVAKLNPAVS